MGTIMGVRTVGQGRRIKGFEGARAPPEHTSAPSHRHLEIKENGYEIPYNTSKTPCLAMNERARKR